MSLTTVSSASLFNNIPRVFGLGRAASPPPSPPTRGRGRKPLSSPRKRQSPPGDSTPLETRGRSRRPENGTSRTGNGTPRTGNNTPRTPASPPRQSRRPSRQPQQRPRPRPPSISTISTLSSLLPAPPPDDESVYEPPAPSWRASLRALEKSNKSPSERVDAWRLGVAAAVPPEVGNNEAASTTAGTSTAVPSVAEENTRTESTRDTEITDSQGIGSLTDEEIFALTQNIKNEEASRRPLVSPISSLAELRAEFSAFADALGTSGTGEAEYAGPNANVLRKIDWLRKHGGWQGIRRTRGDGDCFYRSLAFAYVEKIMTAADPGLAVATALSHLESTLPLLEQAGFQRIVFEDFYEALADVIQQVVPKTGKLPLTNESLLEQFQNPEISNSIVVFLRLLTSSYIRLSPEDDFTPFLIHPDTGEMIDVRTFVETFVEATGREAGKFSSPTSLQNKSLNHPQIMALSKALRVRIEVAYLDNSTGTPLEDGTLPIDFVKFALDGAEEDGTSPVVLLYRPGHYDTLEEKVET